jgi:putative oligomerization/nucleic acid binding protein
MIAPLLSHARAFSLALATVLAGCASVEMVGTASYAPLTSSSDVAIFTAESQVNQTYETLANISYSDPGKFQQLSLSSAFEPLKAKAREVGANGVIIDKSDQIVSGIFSRGISVRARAIRLPTAPSAAASPVTPASFGGSPKDTADALRQLQKLHDDHVITDQEYEAKKAELLKRL